MDRKTYKSGVAGLVLWKDDREVDGYPKSKLQWKLVHEKTGIQVFGGGMKRRADAKLLAERIAHLTDWENLGPFTHEESQSLADQLGTICNDLHVELYGYVQLKLPPS